MASISPLAGTPCGFFYTHRYKEFKSGLVTGHSQPFCGNVFHREEEEAAAQSQMAFIGGGVKGGVGRAQALPKLHEYNV